MALFKRGKSDTSTVIDKMSKLSIADKMKPAKTGFGKMLQNRKIAKFEKSKLSAMRDLGKGVVGRGTEVAKTLIASQTARDLANKNSYQNSLAAWTKNISGNPDPEKGEDGSSQGGSTSELGG